jgi:hypothetical protein
LMSMGSFFPLFALYTNVGLILGLVGIFSYTEKIKVGSFYYYVSGLYSSELTGAIILIIILVSNSII